MRLIRNPRNVLLKIRGLNFRPDQADELEGGAGAEAHGESLLDKGNHFRHIIQYTLLLLSIKQYLFKGTVYRFYMRDPRNCFQQRNKGSLSVFQFFGVFLAAFVDFTCF